MIQMDICLKQRMVTVLKITFKWIKLTIYKQGKQQNKCTLSLQVLLLIIPIRDVNTEGNFLPHTIMDQLRVWHQK